MLAQKLARRNARALVLRSHSTKVTPPSAGIARPVFQAGAAGKRPGTEGRPAEKTAWPVHNRGRFFAMQGDEGNTKTTISVPRESANEALGKLVADLNDLKQQNPGLTLEQSANEVVIRNRNRPDMSLFRVVLLPGKEDEIGFETSSAPGQVRTYKRNEYGEWNCTKDGHNLHGLFVRDILPYIKGMPRFASR